MTKGGRGAGALTNEGLQDGVDGVGLVRDEELDCCDDRAAGVRPTCRTGGGAWGGRGGSRAPTGQRALRLPSPPWETEPHPLPTRDAPPISGEADATTFLGSPESPLNSSYFG